MAVSFLRNNLLIVLVVQAGQHHLSFLDDPIMFINDRYTLWITEQSSKIINLCKWTQNDYCKKAKLRNL